MSKKNFIVYVEPYPIEIMVSVGQSDKELEQCIEKWKIGKKRERRLIDEVKSSYTEAHIAMTHHLIDSGFIVIRILTKIVKPRDHGILAHEIFHSVESIASHVGLSHSAKSSEAFAYMISHITKEIYKRL